MAGHISRMLYKESRNGDGSVFSHGFELEVSFGEGEKPFPPSPEDMKSLRELQQTEIILVKQALEDAKAIVRKPAQPAAEATSTPAPVQRTLKCAQCGDVVQAGAPVPLCDKHIGSRYCKTCLAPVKGNYNHCRTCNDRLNALKEKGVKYTDGCKELIAETMAKLEAKN